MIILRITFQKKKSNNCSLYAIILLHCNCINKVIEVMKRIARVKFGSKSEQLYDYICEDENIGSGDVVFVEGKDYPLFVYEVEKVVDSVCKATKKVIKRATGK